MATRIALFLSGVFWCSAIAQAQWVKLHGPFGGPCERVAYIGTSVVVESYGKELYVARTPGSAWSFQGTTPPGNSYFLTGHGSSLYCGTDSALFRSIDSGRTWSVALPYRTFALSISPAGVILAGTSRINTPHRLFASSDEGQHWVPTDSGLTGSVLSITSVRDTLFIGTGTQGIFKSTDHGGFWTPADSGLPAYSNGTYEPVYAIASTGSSLVAAVGLYLYRSTDGGSHWTVISGITSVTSLVAATGLVFAIGSFLQCSTDGGSTWTSRNPEPEYVGVNAFAVHDSLIMAATGRGMYRSTNQGITWTAMNDGLLCASVSSVAVMGNRIFAGSWTGSMSDDDGSTWQPFGPALAGIRVSHLTPHGNDIFVVRHDPTSICRSTDNGDTWTLVNGGGFLIAAAEGCDTLLSVIEVYGSSANSVFRSTDNGATWNQCIAWGTMYCEAMAFAGRTAFIGTGTGRALRSTDMGLTWTDAIERGPDLVEGIASCCGDIFLATTLRGVLRSTDGGDTWTPVNEGLPRYTSEYVRAIQDIAASGSAVFISLPGEGVFMTTDRGGHWTTINAGLTTTEVITLAIHAGMLYAGTSGSGVWRRAISEVTGIKSNDLPSHPGAFALEQNFPNPFNPSTTLRYVLPDMAEVRLEVYDILGRLVTRLVHDRQAAGAHEATFDASRCGSGIYIARLTAANHTLSRRMILMR